MDDFSPFSRTVSNHSLLPQLGQPNGIDTKQLTQHPVGVLTQRWRRLGGR